MRLKPPKIIRRLMPDLIWEIDDRDGVFLTFDDGPTPGVTEWILSTLDKYDAKATFFVLGKNVEMYPDLYQRILDAGHRVGNHTYSHQRRPSMRNMRKSGAKASEVVMYEPSDGPGMRAANLLRAASSAPGESDSLPS